MESQLDQQERLKQISEWVTLRDDLQFAVQYYAGRANALGFAMRVPERNLRYVKILEWVKACLSPFSLVVKSFTTVLEQLRKMKSTKPNTRRLLTEIEDMLFIGKLAYDIATAGTTPTGAAGVAATLMLKTASVLNLEKTERLKRIMDHFWTKSENLQRHYPLVLVELDSEIDALKV
jgi:hypothetical protein